jgi:hypothetical protein
VVAGILALTTTIALLVIGRARGADVASVRRDQARPCSAARGGEARAPTPASPAALLVCRRQAQGTRTVSTVPSGRRFQRPRRRS